jgi:hypothetical protein
VLEESSGGEEDITTSTNVLFAHDELLSWDRKYRSEEKEVSSIVGASSIWSRIYIEPKNRKRYMGGVTWYDYLT